MKRNLEDNLHKLYLNTPPAPNPEGIQETIMQARQIVSQRDYCDLTFWEFYFNQFSFIRKKVWIFQFIILLVCGMMLVYHQDKNQTIALISSTVPLIFLSGIGEISRAYTYGTLEIELSTQYRLNQVMISRISILGLIDILCLTILYILAGTYTSIQNYAIFLYICVPFMVTCFGCLFILNRIKDKRSNYYCFVLGMSIMTTIALVATVFPDLYIKSSMGIWTILLILSVIGVYKEIHKLLSSCSNSLDYINLSNI
ncbi:MAG: hypothetical protein ACRDC3_03160 [Paraclostridium dentum]|uniref:hypothetical protein n=1 Tax=Paraclostridium dentum TaxID=2662455 RepID=UPI003EE583B1